MVKNVLMGLLFLSTLCVGARLQADNTPIPICITPAFEFRCFLDKISVPGTVSIMTAILGIVYLHRALDCYIHRQTTILHDQTQVAEPIMRTKARNYGIASAIMLGVSAAYCYRAPIKTGLALIPRLLHLRN